MFKFNQNEAFANQVLLEQSLAEEANKKVLNDLGPASMPKGKKNDNIGKRSNQAVQTSN